MEEEKDLLSWLTNLNLSEYHVTLTSNGYLSPKQLVSIKDRDHLKAIGVVKMGHVSRLLRAIEKFRSDGGGGGGSGDDGGDEDMRMSSPLSQVPESPVPVDGTCECLADKIFFSSDFFLALWTGHHILTAQYLSHANTQTRLRSFPLVF